MSTHRIVILFVFALTLTACATSPTGRRQIFLVSDTQVNEMGRLAFDDLKQKKSLSNDRKQTRYVSCIANLLTRQLPAQYQQERWEVQVFQDDSPNAFALPGNKIGVHTGMIKLAKNQDQLAAVIGHEIGHVIAKHSNERMSTDMLVQQGIGIVDTFLGPENPAIKNSVVAALGIGSQFGIVLPFSRNQESEADIYGQELMAKSGFNPRAAIELWQLMAASGGGKSPEFMSTHPSSETRIKQLTEHLSVAMPIYQRTKSSGYSPICR